jgi:hypothetical protein
VNGTINQNFGNAGEQAMRPVHTSRVALAGVAFENENMKIQIKCGCGNLIQTADCYDAAICNKCGKSHEIKSGTSDIHKATTTAAEQMLHGLMIVSGQVTNERESQYEVKTQMHGYFWVDKDKCEVVCQVTQTEKPNPITPLRQNAVIK